MGSAGTHTPRPRKLDALIGNEDLGLTMPGDRFLRLQRRNAPHGDRNPSSQNPAAGPVHHRDQIHEAHGHRDVSISGRHNLVRPFNHQAAQQITNKPSDPGAPCWCWAFGRSPPVPSLASAGNSRSASAPRSATWTKGFQPTRLPRCQAGSYDVALPAACCCFRRLGREDDPRPAEPEDDIGARHRLNAWPDPVQTISISDLEEA